MALQQVWLRRGALAWALRPVAWLFGTLAAARRALFALGWMKRDGVPVPVVVVGNVVAGGAGKTPVVMAIARHFQARGVPVGIVSRGHGRSTDDCREVRDDSDPREVGDEPALLRHATGAPVFVARRRVDAARALLARHPDVRLIVSDDGLQHLALRRDVEICVFDDRGIGNGWLLPAGPLREPWPRACDLVLHTGGRPEAPAARAIPGFGARRALADHALRRDGTTVPLADLRSLPLVAVAAIAKPESFFSMLRERDLTLAACVARPDHDDFAAWTPPTMVAGMATPIVVCTEKDAIKLWRRWPDALAVPLVFEPEPAFFEALDAKLSSLDGFQAA
ncbi:MAG: tetraacyldisaccharide 4'-kinase [Variovorax sp.]|nr:MAG: tetraacyldisaccharide 4'-kinase [Variovorax sp.]